MRLTLRLEQLRTGTTRCVLLALGVAFWLAAQGVSQAQVFGHHRACRWGPCAGGYWGGCWSGWCGYGCGYGACGCCGCYGSGFLAGPWSDCGDVVYSTMPGTKGGKTYGSPNQSLTPTPGVPRNSILMKVTVPPEAFVYINGMLTQQQGEQRVFVSADLELDRSYSYELKAEFIREGVVVTRTKQVVAKTGDRVPVAFDFDAPETPAVAQATKKNQATLKLNVPSDARVYLGGHATNTAGTTRWYAPTMPASGQESDYVVRVELERDGQKLVREERVALSAGEFRELSIGFDRPESSVAASVARP